jgi:pimeloyl-ACP methyl ester carboxylesterase
VGDVSDHSGELDAPPVKALPVFWRSAPGPTGPGPPAGASDPPGAGGPAAGAGGSAAGAGGPAAVALYLHGVPTNSDDWLALLGRTGGLAVDLPGFGRSGKPGHFDYTIAGYTAFLERYLDLVGVRRVSLVMHDWGVVGLAFAERHPARVARLVIIDGVPLLAGAGWHPLARVWRAPLLGELAMGASTRAVLRQLSRRVNAAPGPLPESWLDSVVDHFDQGTQRAILRLHRSAPAPALVRAGSGLAGLTMPALVVWGLRDRCFPPRFGRAYADVLPAARLIELADAGHVPWLDRPDLLDEIERFLLEREP